MADEDATRRHQATNKKRAPQPDGQYGAHQQHEEHLMKTSEALDAAANDIERNGWAVASPGLISGTHPHCVLGAIGEVLGCSATTHYSTDQLAYRMEEVGVTPTARTLASYLGVHHWEAIYRWNDEIGRTADEVIAALRAAAVIEAAKENDSRADLAAVGVAATGEAVR